MGAGTELDRPLAELVSERAAERGTAVAVEDGPHRLTYAELDAAGARIAAALLAAGLDEEEPVAVCLPRSWQAVCAYLGVLRAGGAYVPVNPSHPARRQAQLCQLAGARLALTGAAHGRRLPGRVGTLDAELLVSAGPEPAPPLPAGGDRLAYVLFTSGSSGTPKGVEVTQRGLVNLMRSGADLVPRGEDTVLHVAPLDFDMSALEIWGALLNGGRLVVAPPGPPDPVELARLIAARGVTFIVVAPAMLGEMLRSAPADLGGLRLVVCGGDVLPPATAAELRAAHPAVRLLNGYGPTETTVAATSFELTAGVDGEVPIGRAHPGYRLHVLDPDGEPVAPGEPGELWIGGAGVARGYRGDPERTAVRFRPDPFDGGTMYRSGDRVRVRDDGELLFLGRLDEQVKVGGQRIEPGEVERVLEAHEDVAEAAVVAREDVPGHRRLVAYAAPRDGARIAAADLTEHLAARLPRHMVPATIVVLDALPRGERGKLDRAALPAPRRRPAPAPADPEVAGVAAAMAEVLRLDSVGPHDDFFDLGGTSLLALQLAGRLRRRHGAGIEIGTVFEERTAAALAKRIERGDDDDRDAIPPLLPGPRTETAPLSGAQRRAWLFGRMHPDSIAYQAAAIFRLRGQLDGTALRAALADLIARHEILRTAVEERGGEPVQAIREECPAPLEEVDLRGEDRGAWARLARARVRTRIDPGRAPLARWTLARLGEESWALLQVEHHLVHDGWSFAVLAGELAELYSARREGRPPALPPPVVQFRDYVRWERRLQQNPAVRAQVRRRAAALDPDPPLLELPGARRRPPRESFAGGAVRRRVGPDLVEPLRALGRESGATLFMVALAAFLVQLRRYSGRDDQQVGSGLANRRDPSAERLIGMVVNTVALGCDLGGDPTVRELLERVRAAALDAYADADAPFEAVVEAVGARRDPSRSPLIQTLFSFHDTPRGAERWSGLDVEICEGIPNGTAKADLNVIGIVGEDGRATFTWEHSDLLTDAAADRLAGHHLRLLEQFVARPEARLSELDLLSGDERLELKRWNAAAGSYDREATIPALVEAQAERDPGATAVVDAAERLGYGELLSRARAVAGALRGRGVERGDRVGVLLERSAGAPVAQLGVLLAGAAYVPLDPMHPPVRTATVLAGAGATAVLTDAGRRHLLPPGLAVLELDEAVAAAPVREPAIVAPGDLAYVVYTSGSTGQPKGVEVTHRNVVRLVDDPAYAELGAGTTMLHAASPAFDATTLEIWGPLANGGAVACLAEQPSPDAVAAAIERWGVTTLWLTAGLFHELVDRRPECLSGVRQLLAGGDVLSPEHVRRALAALPPGGRLTNGYGPTETTTFATTHELRPGDPVDGPIPIGRPVQGTTCHVLDADGNELPVGAEGELAIGGDGVARGYRGDPELTAARFRPDPERPGERRYLSGDRVVRRPDGALEFRGRRDGQVKVRGVRVEPAEVESVLRTHARVADAAVVAFERAPRDLALAAYVVAAAGTSAPEAASLRAHASARLPAALVPSAWIPLRSLPLTANGKLDRARLPAPGAEHLARPRRDARPRGDAERRVVECFEAVLKVSPVGAEDDFFALGGNSLLALTLFEELERIGGRRLPLALIFEASTPRALAAQLGGGGAGAAPSGWENLVALKPTGSRPPLFAVAAGDGNIVGFGPLARHISAEQPFYALQPSGLDGRRPLDAGIEAMAARYLGALREVQPRGPYLLAGRCNGATVAFEMAQQLRAAGETVAMLAALDSDPPSPKPLELAPGVPYDPMMEAAWIRARAAGETVPDLGDPEGPARLAAWLRAPAGPGISRYLHEAWRWRDDLRAVWPEPLGADGPALAQWAWDHGREEYDLAEELLEPLPGGPPPARQRWTRRRARGERRARELAAALRARALDTAERRLDRQLPEARQRIERHVVAAARGARAGYRADPWPGRVVLVTSTEFERKPTYPAWEVRALGGVDRRPLPVGHVEMLREPGAALLAACLEECIAQSLSLNSPSG